MGQTDLLVDLSDQNLYLKIIGNGLLELPDFPPANTFGIQSENLDFKSLIIGFDEDRMVILSPEDKTLLRNEGYGRIGEKGAISGVPETYGYLVHEEDNYSTIAYIVSNILRLIPLINDNYDIVQVNRDNIDGGEDEGGTVVRFSLKKGKDHCFIFATFVKEFDSFANISFTTVEEKEINSDIAKITDPKTITLSDNPNFVSFENKDDKKTEDENQISIIVNPINSIKFEKYTKFKLIGNNSEKFEFIGTNDITKLNNKTFFVYPESGIVTAQNIKECFLQNAFLSNNYHITTRHDFENNKTMPVIDLVPKNKKAPIALEISLPETNRLISIKQSKIVDFNNDSILKGTADPNNVAIELEVYTHVDKSLHMGVDSENSLGTYMTTLSKSYHGQPLWFNLNTLMQNKASYSDEIIQSILKKEIGVWRDAGTATDFRFVAKRFDGANHQPFYLSEVMYNITGYKRNLEENDLSDYVYNYSDNISPEFKLAKPLTNQPKLTHIEGQTQFFNFILLDKNRDIEESKQLGLVYSLFSQSNRFLADIVLDDFQPKNKFKVVNSIALDIDQAIEKYTNEWEDAKQVGWVKVALAKDDKIVSETLDFQILPSCLYKVKDYAFLNSLGGWSSFNFGGTRKTDFKANANTIFRTQTPDFDISSQIESVFNKEVKEDFTIETSPINEHTVNWLKEMSTSQAVYELSTGRYIVVSDMKINPNSKDELFRVEMKYRYSDSYNAIIK